MFWRVLFVAIISVGLNIAAAVAHDPTTAPGSPPSVPSFSRDVIPALTRAGCNGGACHGSFQGRGGLTLSLLGFDAALDYDALVKQSRGRRLSATLPAQSLLLMKPTGAIPHGGGRLLTTDAEISQLLANWIAAGTPGPKSDDLAGLSLATQPTELSFPPGATQAKSIRVLASFGDGSTRDVTRWAHYEMRDKSIATVDRHGTVHPQRRGKTSLAIKYLGQVATITVAAPHVPQRGFEFSAQNFIDEILIEEWKRMGVSPAPLADDGTFLRRVSLDLIGTLPTVAEARAFLEDADPRKRSRVIDELLQRPEFVDYWSLKWGDLLRAHRRYLGEKGLASLNGWIRQSVRENKPLDVMTREILTARGNLFTNGPVAYYFIDEKVEDLAETTAQVFLGVRLQCTRCHHHPSEVWSQQDYYGLAAFFTRLEIKDSGTQGARFGGPKSLRPSATENSQRKPMIAVPPRVLSTRVVPITLSETDPRETLAQWITDAENPYFARNFANRYWAALFGRGLVDPVDDLRTTNPASVPQLMDALAGHLVETRYNPRLFLRTVCNSRTYQLATELAPAVDEDAALVTHRRPRRLAAEVLLDAINQVAGTQESFAGQPAGKRAIALPDPAVPSLFLTTFGKPARNSACDCARISSPDLTQTLYLANSLGIQEKLASPGGRLAGLQRAADDVILEELYLAALTRRPTADEAMTVRDILATSPTREEAWQDILWALLNCSEFVLGH